MSYVSFYPLSHFMPYINQSEFSFPGFKDVTILPTVGLYIPAFCDVTCSISLGVDCTFLSH